MNAKTKTTLTRYVAFLAIGYHMLAAITALRGLLDLERSAELRARQAAATAELVQLLTTIPAPSPEAPDLDAELEELVDVDLEPERHAFVARPSGLPGCDVCSHLPGDGIHLDALGS